jgi:hypothetical protein
MRVAVVAGLLLVPVSMGRASLPGRVRERAANEFHCPEDSIEVEDLGSGGYRATGCDVTATYVCARTLDALPAPTRDQLDGLFLAPPK